MTDPAPDRYRLQVTGPAARALAGRLPEKIAAAVYEFGLTQIGVGNAIACDDKVWVANSHRPAHHVGQQHPQR